MPDLALNVQNSRLDNIIQEGLKERKILLNFEITDSVVEEISWHILRWNAEDKNIPTDKRKPIIIYINSVGGDVANAFNVIDVIRLSKTPVIGVVMGYAYSCGALILLACHKRYGFELSTYLIHDGVAGASSSAGKFKDIAKFYDDMDNRIKDLVLLRTKMTEEFYNQKYASEFYFFSDEAKELGVIDGIIGQDVSLDEII